MKDGTTFNAVTFLEAGTHTIKNWLVWNVMPMNADLLKGLKVGDKIDFQVTGKIGVDYDDNLKIKGSPIKA